MTIKAWYFRCCKSKLQLLENQDIVMSARTTESKIQTLVLVQLES
jgi:hypothetical protein